MTYKKIIAAFVVVITTSLILPPSKTSYSKEIGAHKITTENFHLELPEITSPTETLTTLNLKEITEEKLETKSLVRNVPTANIAAQTNIKSNNYSTVFTVPFYSQFTDISAVEWRKVGCGIASLAMLIEYYEPGSVTVDKLLNEGITSGAYLDDAGWTHSGLINLSKKYGLTGGSYDMAGQSMESAFSKLKDVLKEGPVMVSVHYTFDPKNPIPHLVVINGVSEGRVYYNDPAEKSGAGSITIEKFQSSWKKRYIEIREA